MSHANTSVLATFFVGRVLAGLLLGAEICGLLLVVPFRQFL